MQKSTVEVAASLTVAAVSGFGLMVAQQYNGQSGLMPVAVTAAALVLSGLWCLQSLRSWVSNGEALRPDRETVLKVGLMVAGMIVYILAIPHLGFFTATFLTVPLLARGIGYRNLRVSLLSTLGFVAILYAVFRLLLKIPLPPEFVLTFFQGVGQ